MRRVDYDDEPTVIIERSSGGGVGLGGSTFGTGTGGGATFGTTAGGVGVTWM